MKLTLMQPLPELIARLEAKRGSESKFVKELKEQLRAIKETQGKSAQDLYPMLAPEISANDSCAEIVDYLEDGQYRMAKFKHQKAQFSR